MDKIIGNIYMTYNYDKFKKLENNREVLDSRLNRLLASFKGKEILNPIVVNEKYEIVDGQGRYEAKKILKRPIYYIVAKGATIDDCRRMNKYNTRWSAIDFVKSYINTGNENYILLYNLYKELNMPFQRILRLANRTTFDKKSKKSVIENGTLKFTKNNYDTVVSLNEHAKEVLSALQFTDRTNDAFWIGLKICTEFEGYSEERMVKNCTLYRHKYAQMSSITDQLSEFSTIYNYRKRSGFIYFEDYMRNKGKNARSYDDSYFNFGKYGKDKSTLR